MKGTINLDVAPWLDRLWTNGQWNFYYRLNDQIGYPEGAD